ncbi:MAG TPA: hypothetical protein VGH29_12250, partial [Candidatus Binataceae bacterium]
MLGTQSQRLTKHQIFTITSWLFNQKVLQVHQISQIGAVEHYFSGRGGQKSNVSQTTSMADNQCCSGERAGDFDAAGVERWAMAQVPAGTQVPITGT